MGIILIAIVVAFAAAFFISRHIRDRKKLEFVRPESKEQIDRLSLMLTVQPCRSIINEALECLSSNDVIAVCKNHRLGSKRLASIKKMLIDYTKKCKDSDNVPVVYHGYMLEAAEKIAETSRHIITSPDNYMPISYKCEIESIRASLDRLLQSADDILHSGESAELLEDEIRQDKDFIKHTIAIHSKGMSHKEFDDGAPAYSYLMLLYYLHSFVSSFFQVIKNIELNNNKSMTA